MKIKNIFTVVAAVAVCALAVATTAAVGDTNPSNDGGRDANASDGPGSSGSLTPGPIQGVPKRLPAIAARQLEEVPGAVPAESVAALEAPVGTLYLTPTADGACISFVRVGLGRTDVRSGQSRDNIRGLHRPARRASDMRARSHLWTCAGRSGRSRCPFAGWGNAHVWRRDKRRLPVRRRGQWSASCC
jgi:hypothetical protein